jgi:hypothetical protein
VNPLIATLAAVQAEETIVAINHEQRFVGLARDTLCASRSVTVLWLAALVATHRPGLVAGTTVVIKLLRGGWTFYDSLT